jgi:transcriptional regulator with XRE-family HTH domain
MQVAELLSTHPTIKTQKQLADALGKNASEISKWLSGLHNITLESITKMEAVFGADIIMTDIKAKEKYGVKKAEKLEASGKIVVEAGAVEGAINTTPKQEKKKQIATAPSALTVVYTAKGLNTTNTATVKFHDLEEAPLKQA